MCARYVACELVPGSAEATCRASVSEGCAATVAEVKAGRRTFAAGPATACLAQIPSDSCADIGSECGLSALFPGSVATGGACKRSGDCAAGTCQGTTETTCGSCVAFGALGAACGTDGGVTCAPDAYCASNACAPKLADGSPCSTRRACTSGVCNYDNYLMDVPDAGRTCGTHPAGVPCADTGDCDDGLWCAGYLFNVDNYDTLRDGVCTERPAAGSVAANGTCSDDVDCAAGLWCQLEDGSADGKCVARGGAGADCSYMAALFSNGYAHECLPGYGCGESGCVKMGNVGEACTDSSGCKLMLDCPLPVTDGGVAPNGAPQYGKCAVPVALGGSCYGESVQCAADAFCDAATSTCVALLADNAACTDDSQCASGTCGSSGSCAAVLSCQ
jgi:hypothetical protein